MSWTKQIFTDYETIITASFLNDLQDQIMDDEAKIGSSNIEKTISGETVTVNDGANGVAIKSLVAKFLPSQNLHGYDSPWDAGHGKNLINAPDITTSVATVIFDGDVSLESGTYTLSSSNTDVPVTIGEQTGVMPLTFTLEEAVDHLTISASEAGTFANIQIETGSEATAYAPYSNICPILGKTGVQIMHGASSSDYMTSSLSWAEAIGTVYGGEVDVASGKISVEYGVIDSYNGETLSGRWLSSMDSYAQGKTPSIGAQVVYELDKPSSATVSKLTIKTVFGNNSIWSDCNSLTVTYSADAKLYIDSKFNELRELILNNN